MSPQSQHSPLCWCECTYMSPQVTMCPPTHTHTQHTHTQTHVCLTCGHITHFSVYQATTTDHLVVGQDYPTDVSFFCVRCPSPLPLVIPLYPMSLSPICITPCSPLHPLNFSSFHLSFLAPLYLTNSSSVNITFPSLFHLMNVSSLHHSYLFLAPPLPFHTFLHLKCSSVDVQSTSPFPFTHLSSLLHTPIPVM